jgi:hypothetical protein
LEEAGEYDITIEQGSGFSLPLTYVDARVAIQKGVANGLATLGSDNKIPSAQLPAIAITDTFPVASQAAMLALTAEVGDVAVRTDLGKSFILRVAGASTLTNWQELLTPTDAVLSVNGQTGAVSLTAGGLGALVAANNLSDLTSAATARTNRGLVIGTNVQAYSAEFAALAALSPSNDDVIQRKAGAWSTRSMAQLKTDLALSKSDIGLGSVANTSDLSKPISAATQASLDLKAPLASPALTGTPTAPTASAGTSTTQIATTAFVAGEIATGARLEFVDSPTQVRMQYVANITVSGAACRYGTDNSNALQDAIDDACDLTDGGIIQLPMGTLFMAQNMDGYEKHNIHIRGAGMGRTTVELAIGCAPIAFGTGDGSLNVTRHTAVSDLTVDMRDQIGPAYGGDLWQLY